MRPAVARIDLSALRHNYRLARSLHGGRALAVVKANAYGHGAVACATALAAEADGFAVSCLAEAIELREAGISQPIILLEGVFDEQEMAEAARQRFWIVVHHARQLSLLEAAAVAHPLCVWLKINSGMNRAGFVGDEVAAAYRRLDASGKTGEIVLMTHFARADEPDSDSTGSQLLEFDRLTKHMPGSRSLSNSAAVMGCPETYRDWARPGIMLYGSSPLLGAESPLRPVMRLESRIIAVRNVPAGAAIGYGGRFVAPRPMRIGLVAMGYADGYPRSAPDGTPVAVDGRLSRIVGRVSMDMLTVDLTDFPDAGIGCPVELWGNTVPVNTVAAAAATIAYELLCNVKRVRFEWNEHPSGASE